MAFAIWMSAQDITKGSIAGVVRDASGAVVPAATVNLSSPFGDRSTITSDDGRYAFDNLVVGAGYTLSVEKTGFGIGKIANLVVRVNQRTTADVELTVGATAQTVEVTAASDAAIDVTTTTIGATIGQELTQNVPVQRNISAIIQMSPGVTESGAAGAANPSINGASGLENQYIINGTNVTDPGFGGFGTYSRVFGSLGTGVNFDFIQEVQVKTGGFEAQYGQALGGVVNILTRSGSNEYHGSVYGYWQPRYLEWARPNPNDFTENQRTRIEADARTDFGGDLGGWLIKDRLFWYAGYNPVFQRQYRSAPAEFLNSQLGTIAIKTRTHNYQAKLNFNLTPSHTFEASLFGDPSERPLNYARVTSLAANDDLRASGLDYGSRTWTARYNGVLGRNWIVSANYSNYFNQFTENPKYSGYQITDNVPVQEGTGSQLIRNGLGFLENTESHVDQVSASSSHYLEFAGSHTVQYGWQFEDVLYDDIRFYSGPNFTIPNLPEFGVAAGLPQFGASLIRTHQNPRDPSTPIVLQVTRGNYSDPTVSTDTRYHSAYIQDSWTMFGNRLTFRPGIRYEYQKMSGNALGYTFTPNWGPRIGVIVDPTGNRKQKFFANWGRFFERIPQDIAVRAFSFESSVRGAQYRDQSGTIDLSPANYLGGNIGFSGGPDNLTLIAGGTKSQYQDEVVGGYERQFRNMSFSGRFVYRHLRRALEDISGVNITQYLAGVPQQYVVSNPSADLDIFTNASPCTSGANCDPETGFTAVTNPLGSDGIADGFPNPTRIYKAMELVVSKRMSSNWQVFANYRLAKLYGNFEGLFRNDNTQQDPNISSLFDFTNSDGRLAEQALVGVLPTDRRHQFKLFTNYTIGSGFMKGLNLGASWLAQSGAPISKFLAHPAYDNSGEIPVGGRGSLGRTAPTYPFDVHGDYTIKATERMSVKLVADVFNAFNQKKILRVDQNFELDSTTPNPDFLKPNTTDFAYPFMTPRSVRLALRLEF
jgi:outer membrane receptor for ferrienterochelin and colicin